MVKVLKVLTHTKSVFLAVREGWMNYLRLLQVLANHLGTSYTGVRTFRDEVPVVKEQEPLVWLQVWMMP